MKNRLLYFILALLLITSCGKGKGKSSGDKASDATPTMIERIQRSARLYTSEYHIHKIITHKDKVKANGKILGSNFSMNLPLGERRVAIPMDAVIKAYIDFSDFSEKNVKKDGKGKITVILPDPRIVLTSTKINHKEMKQYVAFLRRRFSDAELTSYQQQGRQQIIDAIGQMGIIEHAQENAAKQLIPMLTMLGYAEKDITISFRKRFTMEEITRFIENSTTQTNGKDN